MIKVTVNSTDVRNHAGTSKTTQKPYNMNFQTVWMHFLDRQGKPNPYPEKVEIILDRNDDGTAKVYPVGEYLLHPASLYVDRGGNVAVAPRLAPAKG